MTEDAAPGPRRRYWIPPPERAGKPYFPVNQAEVILFGAQWCDRCERESQIQGIRCPILTLGRRLDAAATPREWVYSPNGLPMCEVFERRPIAGEVGTKPRANPTIKTDQQTLF